MVKENYIETNDILLFRGCVEYLVKTTKPIIIAPPAKTL